MNASFLNFSHDILESLPGHQGIKTMNSPAVRVKTLNSTVETVFLFHGMDNNN